MVILARTPVIEHSRRQLDFLTALPVMAWPANCRNETLASLSRNIGWLTACA